MQYDYYSDTDSRPEAGELSLAVAILQRAVEDYRNGKTAQREDARRFVSSGWFVVLADGCGLDVRAVRERLRCNDAR